jgi:hypothetical protein
MHYHKKRRDAVTKLMREEHKSMLNLVVGKFLIDNLKFPIHEHCESATRARILMVRDKFDDVKRLGDNLSLFTFNRESGIDTNLRLVAETVLEISKLNLYDCYSNKLKPFFWIKCRFNIF